MDASPCVACGAQLRGRPFCHRCGHRTEPRHNVDAVPADGLPERKQRAVWTVWLIAALLVIATGASSFTIATVTKDDGRETTNEPHINDMLDDEAGAISTPAREDDGSHDQPEAAPPSAPYADSWSDRIGDSEYGNDGLEFVSSADISRVHVRQPTVAEPGWIVVQLAERGTGTGVIVRVDSDDDGLPDLTAWQHTSTGTSGSFAGSDWSHGRDILDSGSSTVHEFQETAYAPPVKGVAFPLRFDTGDLAYGTVRINVQTVNDAGYYDYYPRRQRWSRAVPFEPIG